MEPPTLWCTIQPTAWRSPSPDSMTPALRQACPSTSIRGHLSCQLSLHFAAELPCSNLQRVEASDQNLIDHPHILWYGWITVRLFVADSSWCEVLRDFTLTESMNDPRGGLHSTSIKHASLSSSAKTCMQNNKTITALFSSSLIQALLHCRDDFSKAIRLWAEQLYQSPIINYKCIQVELTMWCCLTVRFHYMAIADDRQRLMPAPEDLLPDRSVQLAYPEARRLTNPIEPALQGEVCVQCLYKHFL